MFALLYVSKAHLPADRERDELAAIVRISTRRNVAASVTGALLFTGDHFAQWLEGDEAAVRSIMASIQNDARHAQITVLEEGSIERRRFDAWSLAYSGRSTFANVIAARALQDRDDYAVGKLKRLLQELAGPLTPPPSEA